MPDPGDRHPGLIESTRRFCSLFSEWICSLTFKQFADQAKARNSPSYLNPVKEQDFDYNMDIVTISSSSLGSEFDLDSSDDELQEVSKPDTSYARIPEPEQATDSDVTILRKLPPNWAFDPDMHAKSQGSQNQHSKLPFRSGRGTHLNVGQRSQAESSASTSYAHEQGSNRRTLPSSVQPSGLHPKQNHSWETVGSSRNNGGIFLPVALGAAHSLNYANDNFKRGYDNEPYMFDSNRPRILPHSLMRGKAVPCTQYASSSDPFQNMGFGEERVTGDERVIYQAALRDINQPTIELDVPDGVLSVPLLRHQKIALAWMIDKEANTHCVGGILADDQGLGKTISTIALIQKQRFLHSEKHDNHIAVALDLDDDDDGEKGKKINDVKCKSEQTCNNEPVTLNLDDDDDCIDSVPPVTEIKKEENDVPKHNSSASSSRQISLCPTSSRRKPAAGTLIVCPATVLKQWARELDDKVAVGGKLSVLVYHGGNRTKDPVELSKYDVVLTTYAIVTNEVPKQPIVDEDDVELKFGERHGLMSDFSANKKRKHSSTSSKKGKKGRKLDDGSLCSAAGTLAKVSWLRVVLDEAQTIKNHRTQAARACCGLRAKRRWCLSGTPIQNSIDEMYSYFRFLRHGIYSDYKKFCDNIKFPISRDPVLGYKKLQAVLKTLLLRRTKSTILDGQPIISLPPKHIEMKSVKFTIDERDFYRRLEAQSRSQFKEYAAAGTVNQNYANILLMILRLRQACDHPLLVKGFHSQPARITSLDEARKLSRHMLIKLLSQLESSSAICLICSDPAEDAVITICGHVFCYQCVGDYFSGDDTMCPARKCKEQLSEDILFSEATLRCCLSGDSENHSSNDKSKSSPILKKEYVSSKIKAALSILLSNCKRNNPCMELDGLLDTDLEKSLSPQVRTDKTEASPSHGPIKTIVFSQWTGMLDLFQETLKRFKLKYRRLDGSMSLVARDRAVRDFNSDPEVSIMLMSLKAGNLGLNMVAACHVILLDLWWNPTTEDQAVDRAHRIGQTRPVTVSRITVKDTVEDRILALQEEKRKMVASAFGEDHVGGSGARLTIDDLKYLFLGSRGL